MPNCSHKQKITGIISCASKTVVTKFLRSDHTKIVDPNYGIVLSTLQVYLLVTHVWKINLTGKNILFT